MVFFKQTKLVGIISLTLIIICSSIESNKLKLLFVVHRHGDRTPVFNWPTDPYSDEQKYWPDGFGMLTTKGKQRMFSVGKYIRKRFKNFLTDNPREVYVRSSEKERCLESVSLILAGLYPPVNRWKWDNGLGQVWQPFPIHTTNLSHDGILCPEAICKNAEKETNRVMRSEMVKKFMKKHHHMIKYIEEKSGHKLVDYRIGRDMWSTIFIQKLNGYKLPDWINTTVYEQIEHFSDMAFTFDGITPLQHRLRAGLLLREIAQNIDRSIKRSDFRYKILLYSTHDTFLSIFLGALKAFDRKSPPFGATVLLKLFQLSDKSHEIQVDYLNETETERPHRLSFRCGSGNYRSLKCPLDQFLEGINGLIINDYEKDCNTEKSWFKISAKIEL